MIYFNINIRNPRWWNRWEGIKHWSGSTPFKHKFWEVQFMKNSELFRIEFNWTVQQDHAGVQLELGLFGYQLDFNFYDNRHWDTETNSWKVYDIT
jgi:hypothetical protein